MSKTIIERLKHAAISKEERAEYVLYSRKLKKDLTKIIKKPIGVRVYKSQRPNPFIEVTLKNWRTDIIPNDFRKLIVKKLGLTGVVNMDDISYGNIREKSIALHYEQWKDVLGK